MIVSDFEKILLESVDESLSHLGELCQLATHFYLEKGFNIRKYEIPHKIDEFTVAMEEIFGSGAEVLEIQIMKLLNDKVNQISELDYKQDDLEFTEYIKSIRRSFTSKKLKTAK